MRTDGQLYKDGGIHSPPGIAPHTEEEKSVCVPDKSPRLRQEELLLIGLIILIMSDKKDMPLILALAYILLAA